jgi:pantothenate kinase
MSIIQEILQLETPAIIAVDGRSASGKTTFATQLAKQLDAPLVHTDDIAWNHSFFDWWELAIVHILEPFKCNQTIHWTPEAWLTHGREGAIIVPIAPILIFEGVSATRVELQPWIDFPIWIETDIELAEQRGLERDGESGRDFWFEWQAVERSFLEKDQPWTRAKKIVDGMTEFQF